MIFKNSYRMNVAAWSALISGSILLVFAVIIIQFIRVENMEVVEKDTAILCRLILTSVSHQSVNKAELLSELGMAMAQEHETPYMLLAVKDPDGHWIYKAHWLWVDRYESVSAASGGIVSDDDLWRIHRHDMDDWQVFIANNREETELEYLEIVLSFGLTIPICLLAIAFSGWWIVWKALNPVTIITKRLTDIDFHNLSARLLSDAKFHEIQQLTDTINLMLDRLEAGQIQSRRFTADASHELRTPLAIIQGELEARLTHAESGEMERLACMRMLEEVHRMKALTHSLLFLSKVDGQSVQIKQEKVNMGQLLEQAFDEFHELAADAGLDIHLQNADKPLAVQGDPDLLLQVVRNLLKNGLRYNRADGTLTCKVERVDKRVRIVIGNSGPAIPDSDKTRIFERFFRIDMDRNRETGGFGLGLNLAREIARLHRGDVILLRSQNDWTEFALILPLSDE